jgi:3-oxoadipate enol-lactonase
VDVIVAGDRHLAWREAGRGRDGGAPLVLLHGFPHDHRVWARVHDALAGTHHVLAPDLRGFGLSSGPPVTSLDDYVDDVLALLDARGLAQATLVGLSMGGYIALALWRRAPERVAGLVLTDTRAGADDAAAREARQAQIAAVLEGGVEPLVPRWLAAQLGPTTIGARPAVIAAHRALLAGAPPDGVIGALRAMAARRDATPLLATVTVPTLVVVGAEDTLTPVAEAEGLHAGIAGSVLSVIDGAGHLPPLETPVAFADAVARWSRAVGGR